MGFSDFLKKRKQKEDIKNSNQKENDISGMYFAEELNKHIYTESILKHKNPKKYMTLHEWSDLPFGFYCCHCNFWLKEDLPNALIEMRKHIVEKHKDILIKEHQVHISSKLRNV
jgi:hypothetical protein